MGRLYYNVYSNINEKEYFAIEDKLVILESAIASSLRNSGWKISEPVRKSDGLGVDFIYKDLAFHGNMGILFEDIPNIQTFTFYVTKSFDEKHKRYFIRADIFQKKEFEYFEDNVADFVSQALEQYKAWSRYNIIYSGVTIDLK